MPRPSNHPSYTATPTPPMKRIIISFSVAVIAIILLVLYYTLAQATITLEIEPANEVMETSLAISPDNNGDVTGMINSAEVTESKNFPASPSGEKEDKASGIVNLINNTSAAQTLIATTRLLTPDNVLFRLKQTVTIPTNGKLANVAVIADQSGEASSIGPTKFTIPGLRPALREKIYAESTEPMRRAEKAGSTVTALDLDGARKTLTDKLTKQALAKLREQLPADKRELTIVYKSETTKAESNIPAGTKKSEFTYTTTVKVTAVFYDRATLTEKAIAKLQQDLSNGRKILTLAEESLAVNVDNISDDLKTATLKVKFMAKVTIVNPEVAFKKADLFGRTPEEVKNYFKAILGVRDAQTELSPFWVKTVPTVENHINLQIK